MGVLTANPAFGVLLALVAYQAGLFANRKIGWTPLNPLLIAVALVILFLKSLHIPYENFNQGGKIITFFLGPITVALALPLYKEVHLLKRNAFAILMGIFCGAVAAIICVVMLAIVFGFSEALTKSLVPKSVTSPIGYPISIQLGGDPSITVAAILITGMIGAVLTPFLERIFQINDKIAVGVAMGTSSHGIGTAKAIELGKAEGAMSALAMAVCGLMTVVLAPVMWHVAVAMCAKFGYQFK